MNSFQTALSAVLPMFVMLGLGIGVRKIGLADKHTLGQLNKLCFRCFLAVNVYYNICKVNIAEVFNARLLIYAISTQFVILAIAVLAGMVTEKEAAGRPGPRHLPHELCYFRNPHRNGTVRRGKYRRNFSFNRHSCSCPKCSLRDPSGAVP